MTARLRQMMQADIPSVLQIESVSFPTPWSSSLFYGEISRPTGRYWTVVESDGRLLGYAGLMEVAGEAHVLNLAVHPDFRKRGLGVALLGDLMRHALEDDVSRVTLEVRPSNSRAIALYERAGFELVGMRPNYYDDTGEDAMIMWTGDISQPPYPDTIRQLAEDGKRALAAFGGNVTQGTGAIEPSPRTSPVTILAIESSCDETAAAVMRDGRELLSSVVATQVDFHRRFGGVVPEIASRKHTEAVVGVVDEALDIAGITLDEVTALAVTQGPGLVGALVVGLAYAKGLSFATGLPLVGVNHLEGHIFANILADESVRPPLIALVVSGGHTSLVHLPDWGEYHTLGATLDDAAGEAFDKVAKVLGLGYPGGPVLSKLAEEGDSTAIGFPRAMMNTPDYDFSLSGLKTAVITYIRKEQEAGRPIDNADLAASFQAAVVDVQVAKSVRAALQYGVKTFCLAGGVAANPVLRERLRDALAAKGVRLSVPPLAFCTDNAAMIAAAAYHRFLNGESMGLDAEALPNLRLDA